MGVTVTAKGVTDGTAELTRRRGVGSVQSRSRVSRRLWPWSVPSQRSRCTVRDEADLYIEHMTHSTLRPHKSRLPLTDPRHTLPHARRVVNEDGRSVCRTDERPKTVASLSQLTTRLTVDVQLRNSVSPELGQSPRRKHQYLWRYSN